MSFAGGPNIAMKVPPHQWTATVAFYRDVLGLEELPPVTGEPPSVGFAFGANRLWIDRVAGMSQAELWLELTADDPHAAARTLAAAPGVARCDEIEPLSPGSPRFWIASPSQIVHLVGPSGNGAGEEAGEAAARELHRRVLDGWNRADAEAFAAPFAEDGALVGPDGSTSGRDAIAAEMGRVFAGPATGTYVGRVSDVRPLGPHAAVLRATAEVVPAGRPAIEPALEATQTLVAERRAGDWEVVLYQTVLHRSA